MRHFERLHGGAWAVHFVPLAVGRERFAGSPMFVTCDLVFLAAGTLGSTEILYRSRDRGLSVSGHLGRSFGRIADALGFGYNGSSAVNGVGAGPHVGADVGPCVTEIIDMRQRDRACPRGW